MIALDLETTWSDQYSVATLGLDRYVLHPQFRVTLVALWSPEFQWVGPPRELPVERIEGQQLCAHNAEFDSVCCRLAIHRGQMPAFEPAGWTCTADMACWHQLPRSLKGATKELFAIDMSKQVRDDMKNLDPEMVGGNPIFRQYALDDAKASWEIWNALQVGFPEKEALLSQLTRRIAGTGLPFDGPMANDFIMALEDWEMICEKEIPWRNGPKPAAIGSTVALIEACKLDGIPPPPSTNEDDPECMIWKATYPAQGKWVDAMTRHRKVTKAAKQLLSILMRKRPDGRVSTRLKYCGAPHTGRWSGTGGVNFQALPRGEVEGTSVKKCLKAPAGKVLVTVDLSQIEPRILHWLAGDMPFLGLLAGGIDLYEAHGRASGLYKEDEPMKDFAPELRHLCKARVLGLGYGCGAKRFAAVAEALTAGNLTLDAAQAAQQVAGYRKQNPLIPALWQKLEDFVKASIPQTDGDVVVVDTRSGKPIRYFEVKEEGGRLSGTTVRGGHRKKLWGGLLTENLVQATAREIFAEGLLKVAAANLPICLHVHDSITVEVAEAEGRAALDLMVKLMTEPPAWAEGLPLAAEGEIRGHY